MEVAHITSTRIVFGQNLENWAHLLVRKTGASQLQLKLRDSIAKGVEPAVRAQKPSNKGGVMMLEEEMIWQAENGVENRGSPFLFSKMVLRAITEKPGPQRLPEALALVWNNRPAPTDSLGIRKKSCD